MNVKDSLCCWLLFTLPTALDLHTVAIEVASGKEAWNTTLGDINKGESMTMAPIVAKGVAPRLIGAAR